MRRFWLAVIALLLLYGGVAVGNYAATVGAGTNFGSVVIAGVHFASQLVCDFTTANQCASVSASNALKVDGSASTQPVSGTVTANAGTNLNTSTLATSANQTNGTQQSKITDGASIVAVKAASTASAAADISFVTNESPNSQLSATTGLKADAHSCSAASIIACLGQLDDDVKGSIATGTNNIGQVGGSVNITPTDCSIALTLGGTAQNIITAGATLHGFTIANIDTAAGSGEPVWMSFTGTAAASTIASYPLSAPTATTFAQLSSYTTPLGFGTNANVSVVAATTGHKISCTKW